MRLPNLQKTNLKTMKQKKSAYQIKRIIASVLCLLLLNVAFAQEDIEEEKSSNPVYETWATGLLFDNQTTETPYAQMFEFVIQHRFGQIESLDDLLGIYAPSNIRLGLNYGITDELSVGFGTEKNYRLQDFQAKYRVLTQTEDNKIPVSVAYYANMAIDARDKEFFGEDYKFTNRLSYFHQIIVARKFSEKISLQVAASYSHFNAITDTYLFNESLNYYAGKWKNDYIGVMTAGRYKFLPTASFVFEYSQPISLNEAWEGQSEPMPNLGLGVEFGTSTHAFQVFVSQYDALNPQTNYSHNMNDLTDGDWRVGFNIKVRF